MEQGSILVAGQDGREVEAEPIDVEVNDPRTKAVNDQGANDRVVAVQRVAAPRDINVVLLVGREEIVG